MSGISVIIPTHNRAALLPRAVESARHAGANVEIIVVDDASTDSTPKVASGLTHIRYIRLEEGRHAAGARNVGIASCRTEFVAFLDDDDALLPGSLDLQLRALDCNPSAAFSYGRYYLGDTDCLPKGDPLPEECPEGDVFWKLLVHNFLATHALVIRRSCLDEVGTFDARYPGVEDWDLWIRLAERYPVVSVRDAVAVYNHWTLSAGHLSSSRVEICRTMVRVQARGLSLPRALAASACTRRRIRRRLRDWAANELVSAVGTKLAHGDHIQAMSALLFAFSISPGRVLRPGTARTVAHRLRAGRSARARAVE